MTDEKHEAAEKMPGPPQPAPPWEVDLDVYPLRAGSDDPRWAVRTVWGWVAFGIFSLLFIGLLTFLGAFYD